MSSVGTIKDGMFTCNLVDFLWYMWVNIIHEYCGKHIWVVLEGQPPKEVMVHGL